MSALNFISPFFIVSDLKESVSFYVNKLGFKLWYTGPEDDPFWAMVGRDHISIMLKAIADDIKPVPNHTRHEWARWDAYISAAEPDALFEDTVQPGSPSANPSGTMAMGCAALKLPMPMAMCCFSDGLRINRWSVTRVIYL
jgi:catechol 2,3-dioxygenase-like lactoylglutathione lyase family enzyme